MRQSLTASISESVTSSEPRPRRRGGRIAPRAVRSWIRKTCNAGLIGLAFAVVCPAWAESVYQEPLQFIAETFSQQPPQPKVLWLTGALREQVSAILGHAPSALRERYWLAEGRSAWVMEEIGKDRPITVGLVVNDQGIERIKVLVFRESRGWEVRYPFFTDQFTGAKLDQDQRLDRHIDGISGATLSVRALKKLARVALLLHAQVAAQP